MRRRLLLTGVLLVALAGLSDAAVYKTFETITVANVVIGLSDATINPPGRPQVNRCLLRTESAEIRIRWDGGSPTTTVGHPVEPVELVSIETNEDITALKMVRTGGTSATVTATCWVK